MGKFKPMLPMGDESIIRRTIRMMKAAGTEPVVVVTGYCREMLEDHLSDMDVLYVYNEKYATTKMFDSAILGFQKLEGRCDKILFSPGDIPLIRDDTISRLQEQEGLLIRPVFHKIPGHPIVIDQTILPYIMEYNGPEGLRGAIRTCGVPVCEIPIEDEGTIMDVDRRKDYERMLIENTAYSGKQERLRMDLKLSIGTDELFLDSNMAVFLELISVTGSMSAACQAMHMSYTKGWNMINKLEEKMKIKVLHRNVGGREGGGSMLTPEGFYILQNYNKMTEELSEVGERLEKLGIRKKFPKNYLLAEAGGKAEYCYIVAAGRVISYEYSMTGEERIYSVNEAKSLLLEENLLFGYEVPVNVRTAVDSELICVDRTALMQAVYENPEAAVDIMQSLSMKLLSSIEQMKCMNDHSAMQKVCNLLLIFAERYGKPENGEIVIREKLSQEYISSLLGINRITVVRVIKALREQGLVEKKNGYYCIRDIEQLKDNQIEKWA